MFSYKILLYIYITAGSADLSARSQHSVDVDIPDTGNEIYFFVLIYYVYVCMIATSDPNLSTISHHASHEVGNLFTGENLNISNLYCSYVVI